MTQRERLLAGAVGLLVAGFVLYYGGGWFLTIFSSREEKIEKLIAQRDQLQRDISFGTAARDELADYERRSLPGDLQNAKTRYRDWLFELAEQEGFLEVKIEPGSDPTVKGIGNTVPFTLTAFGRLPRIVDFLHEVYRAELLHRIKILKIVPTQNSRYLSVRIEFEGLWIDTNEGTEIPTEPGERLAFDTPEPYQRAISDRNIFGLANKELSFDVPSTTRVYKGERLNLEVKATDPDGPDELSFALGEGAPEGVQIAPGNASRQEGGSVTRSARIGWTPTQIGTFQIPIVASDDGLPAKSVSKTIAVTVSERPAEIVAEPPPPKPDFDVAKHTQFNAVLSVDGVPEIWLFDRTAGKMHVLRVGDEFEIGSVSATVEEISDRTAIFRTEDGRLRLLQGQFLTEAEKLVSSDEPEAF